MLSFSLAQPERNSNAVGVVPRSATRGAKATRHGPAVAAAARTTPHFGSGPGWELICRIF